MCVIIQIWLLNRKKRKLTYTVHIYVYKYIYREYIIYSSYLTYKEEYITMLYNYCIIASINISPSSTHYCEFGPKVFDKKCCI